MNRAVSVLLVFLAAPIIPAIYYGISYPLSGNRDPVSVVGTFVVAYLVGFIAPRYTQVRSQRLTA